MLVLPPLPPHGPPGGEHTFIEGGRRRRQQQQQQQQQQGRPHNAGLHPSPAADVLVSLGHTMQVKASSCSITESTGHGMYIAGYRMSRVLGVKVCTYIYSSNDDALHQSEKSFFLIRWNSPRGVI